MDVGIREAALFNRVVLWCIYAVALLIPFMGLFHIESAAGVPMADVEFDFEAFSPMVSVAEDTGYTEAES